MNCLQVHRAQITQIWHTLDSPSIQDHTETRQTPWTHQAYCYRTHRSHKNRQAHWTVSMHTGHTKPDTPWTHQAYCYSSTRTQITHKKIGRHTEQSPSTQITQNLTDTLNPPNTQDTDITQKLIGTLNSLHAYRTHKWHRTRHLEVQSTQTTLKSDTNHIDHTKLETPWTH